LKLKGILRADTLLRRVEQPSILLPGLILEDVVIAHLKDFVPALLVESEDRPIRISDEYVWRFVVEVETRFEASWGIGDIRKNGSGKGLSVEIINSRIVNFELTIGIANSDFTVIILTNVELASQCLKHPIILVCFHWGLADKAP
jgi:hypothetical protein